MQRVRDWRRLVPWALAVLAVVAIAACEKTVTTTTTDGKTTTTTTYAPAPEVGKAADKAGAAMADAAVTAKVKAALLADPEVSALAIDVDTDNGVVTLRGAIDNAANVERAAALASAVEGVRSVDSQLVVK